MTVEINQKLKKLGLHPGWFAYGFVDQEFIDKALQDLSSADDEHKRTAFFAKFFKDRETGISDEDIERYLSLVSYEKDALLQSWATGFLVEASCLTPSQLMRLSEHRLIKDNEKHLFFLNRNLAEKMNQEN